MVETRELERAVNEARAQRLLPPGEPPVVDGRRGAKALRAVMGHGATFTRSEAEHRLLHLVLKARLPRPEVNARIGGYEVDALWREQRLVVEVDGYAAHGSRAAFERDRRKDADLQAAGLRVLRVTWPQLTMEPEAAIARIAGTLAR